MSYFTYNGRSSEEFGLHIEKKDVFSAPEYDAEFTSIPGRSGDLIVSNRRFANIKVSYTVFLARKNVADLSEVLRAIKGWLYTEPDRYHEITDSYDTGHLRYGVISGSLDIEEQFNKLGPFRVTFYCKPFKYSMAGLQEISIEKVGSLFNPEAFTAKPVIMLKGSGDFSLTLQNSGYNKTWNFNGITDGVVCDSEQMNFYYGTTLLNDKATGDGFPELPPGETVLTVSGGVSEIKVTPRWCCL
ncbi:MAG: phage tail family protein [Lachnospiraceae bacterium]|nr:phage tail family protein [Lachnospiraceae bacterium]